MTPQSDTAIVASSATADDSMFSRDCFGNLNGSTADLRRLFVFRTVVVAGGVTAAARMLCKTPPAVSYDLRKLEDSIGGKLFRRQGRHLAPTERGQRLAAAVEKVYQDLSHAWRGASCNLAPMRLACVSGFGRYRLVPALLRILAPDRHCEVLFRTATGVQALLAAGRVSLGVSFRPLVGDGLDSSPLASESLVLVGPRCHPLPQPAEVALLPFVTYEEFEYVFIRWFESYAMTLPNPWHRADHFEELEEALEAVACGRGWCIVPLDAATSDAFRSRVTVHRFGSAACHNQLYLVGEHELLAGQDAALVRKAAGCGST